MRIAVLFSGGKDSMLTVYRARQEGHQVTCLLTMHPQNKASYMFHYPNTSLTTLQAESIGIPIVSFPTKGVKEHELKDLKKAISLVADKVDAVAAGALASKYQYDRVKAICDSLGLKTYTPLWQIDPLEEWRQLFAEKFEVMITAVACAGLGKEWLGEVITQKDFEQLRKLSNKHRFHLGFEGGEAETLVLNCPMFKKKIRVVDTKIRWDKSTQSGYLEILKAELK